MSILCQTDPEVAAIVQREETRQHDHLELIASENYTSAAVLEATGSVLTNKYAEGYPAKRYYGGCHHIDEVEQLAIDRAKQLFGAEFANVQAHSGSQANMAVYFTVLKPTSRILAMSLDHGGHLTHGAEANFSGRMYHVYSYGVDPKNERIDFDTVATLARRKRPELIVVGASAYPREIDVDKFADIAHEYHIPLMVDMAHIAGLVAAGLHPDPVPVSDFVTSTTHKTLRGPRSGFVLCKEKWGRKLNSTIFPGIQGGPLCHVTAAKAVAFGEAMKPEFKTYAQQIIDNAKTLAEALLAKDFRLATGGTDNHLMLVDVSVKGLTGKQAEDALQAAGITVNKNLIPFDKQPPTKTSGIRIGTPALTTRGLGADEMKQIAAWIDEVVADVDNVAVQQRVLGEVKQITSQFPVPGIGERGASAPR